jgi:hypothetical protein
VLQRGRDECYALRFSLRGVQTFEMRSSIPSSAQCSRICCCREIYRQLLQWMRWIAVMKPRSEVRLAALQRLVFNGRLQTGRPFSSGAPLHDGSSLCSVTRELVGATSLTALLEFELLPRIPPHPAASPTNPLLRRFLQRLCTRTTSRSSAALAWTTAQSLRAASGR